MLHNISVNQMHLTTFLYIHIIIDLKNLLDQPLTADLSHVMFISAILF